jgi:transcriptional regulator with XRE-family HTH domain
LRNIRERVSYNMSPFTLTVRVARERAGLTQEQLATAAGVRQATVSNLERADPPRRLDLVALEKVAKALGVSPSSLLVWERKGRAPGR